VPQSPTPFPSGPLELSHIHLTKLPSFKPPFNTTGPTNARSRNDFIIYNKASFGFVPGKEVGGMMVSPIGAWDIGI